MNTSVNSLEYLFKVQVSVYDNYVQDSVPGAFVRLSRFDQRELFKDTHKSRVALFLKPRKRIFGDIDYLVLYNRLLKLIP